MDPQSGTPKTLCPSDPLLELRQGVEAKPGTWRWGWGGSKDRVWGGDVPWVCLRVQPQSVWEAVGLDQARSPHGETLCPQRENKGPNPLFPNHCWEVLVPPLTGNC